MMGALGAVAEAQEARARPALGRVRALGRAGHRAPWLSIAAGVLILLVFAFPVTQLRLGQPDDGNQPTERTQRVAYDKLSEAFGAGSNGPFLLAVDTPKGDPATLGQLDRLQREIQETPGIATVAPPAPSEDGEMATIFAIPTTAPQDQRTSDLLERLREDVIPGGHRRHAAEGLRRRQHRGLRGLLGQGRRAAAAVHRGRHRPVGAAADRRVPLAVDPARLRGLQPAVGRRGLRRGRRGLPGGHRREPASASTAACRSSRSSR